MLSEQALGEPFCDSGPQDHVYLRWRRGDCRSSAGTHAGWPQVENARDYAQPGEKGGWRLASKGLSGVVAHDQRIRQEVARSPTLVLLVLTSYPGRADGAKGRVSRDKQSRCMAGYLGQAHETELFPATGGSPKGSRLSLSPRSETRRRLALWAPRSAWFVNTTQLCLLRAAKGMLHPPVLCIIDQPLPGLVSTRAQGSPQQEHWLHASEVRCLFPHS